MRYRYSSMNPIDTRLRAVGKPLAMQFEPTRYSHHLDGIELDEAAKLDLMQQVWAIMEGFVDRAFGESPEQILLGISEGDAGDGQHHAIDSTITLNSTFNDAAVAAARE